MAAFGYVAAPWLEIIGICIVAMIASLLYKQVGGEGEIERSALLNYNEMRGGEDK
jgi:hypothetical protein